MAAQEDLRYQLRLSAELKERLERAAEQNRRSLNQEMVYRLEQSLVKEPKR